MSLSGRALDAAAAAELGVKMRSVPSAACLFPRILRRPL